MEWRFFTDVHIAKAVSIQLRSLGLTVIRCQEVGLADATDVELLSYATQAGCVLLSCDDDFRDLHFLWMAQDKSHKGIIKLDQERHCQHIGQVVKIITTFIELAIGPQDADNQYYEGDSLA